MPKNGTGAQQGPPSALTVTCGLSESLWCVHATLVASSSLCLNAAELTAIS